MVPSPQPRCAIQRGLCLHSHGVPSSAACAFRVKAHDHGTRGGSSVLLAPSCCAVHPTKPSRTAMCGSPAAGSMLLSLLSPSWTPTCIRQSALSLGLGLGLSRAGQVGDICTVGEEGAHSAWSPSFTRLLPLQWDMLAVGDWVHWRLPGLPGAALQLLPGEGPGRALQPAQGTCVSQPDWKLSGISWVR